MLLSELELKRASRDPAVAERPNPHNTRSLFLADAGYRIVRDGCMVLISHSGRTVIVPSADVAYGLVAETAPIPSESTQPETPAAKARRK